MMQVIFFEGYLTRKDIPNSIGSKQRVLGSPAINVLDFARTQVYLKRLPSLFSDVSAIKKDIEALQKD